MFTGKPRGLLGFALAAVLAAGIPAELRAQTTSASVSGSIQDPQGGVIDDQFRQRHLEFFSCIERGQNGLANAVNVRDWKSLRQS